MARLSIHIYLSIHVRAVDCCIEARVTATRRVDPGCSLRLHAMPLCEVGLGPMPFERQLREVHRVPSNLIRTRTVLWILGLMKLCRLSIHVLWNCRGGESEGDWVGIFWGEVSPRPSRLALQRMPQRQIGRRKHEVMAHDRALKTSAVGVAHLHRVVHINQAVSIDVLSARATHAHR